MGVRVNTYLKIIEINQVMNGIVISHPLRPYSYNFFFKSLYLTNIKSSVKCIFYLDRHCEGLLIISPLAKNSGKSQINVIQNYNRDELKSKLKRFIWIGQLEVGTSVLLVFFPLLFDQFTISLFQRRKLIECFQSRGGYKWIGYKWKFCDTCLYKNANSR